MMTWHLLGLHKQTHFQTDYLKITKLAFLWSFFYDLPVSAWILAEYFGLLPQSKDMQKPVRLTVILIFQLIQGVPGRW